MLSITSYYGNLLSMTNINNTHISYRANDISVYIYENNIHNFTLDVVFKCTSY